MKERFTEAQQRHENETLALLLRHCGSGGDAYSHLDGKLEALRDYVRAHLADLASGDKGYLKAVFANMRNVAQQRYENVT